MYVCISIIYSPRSIVKLFPVFTRKFVPRNNVLSKQTINIILTTTENENTYTRPNHYSVLLPSHLFSQTDENLQMKNKTSGKRKISDWLQKRAKKQQLIPRILPQFHYRLPKRNLLVQLPHSK